ncbi:Calcineurin-binding protein cabin-1 [Collichthys lucidus]|uniref:Calcineurin-binding protein cabin-1 n=1 Tax=Collichthys lucidus TaxID=240159 RepID=A0A4U5UVB8_COLLU|nr:Calcineurin-binding protein cabin-1 [Collichthys lucidus]
MASDNLRGAAPPPSSLHLQLQQLMEPSHLFCSRPDNLVIFVSAPAEAFALPAPCALRLHTICTRISRFRVQNPRLASPAERTCAHRKGGLIHHQKKKKGGHCGIWRIPVDEIDRPGSFASHMNRSIVLLLEVLSQLKDHDTLLKVSFMLQRTPDQGKKYLRDVDRQVLAKRAFFLTVKVLEDNLNSLTGVSEQLHKAPAPSMGEMTTTDASNRPSSEDGKHALPKKLTEGACAADSGPREAAQAQLTTPPTSVDKGSKVQESFPGKVETSGSEGHKEEPMELDTGNWRRPSTTTDSQGNQTEAVTSVELQQKVADSSRTPELSLEELSISSRQQQLQASAPKVTAADQGSLRRPNRKRKLLEDVESGKTLLLDAYRVWQQGQKVMTYDLGRIEKIMSETYMLIKQVDEDVALDQAVKFCQIQLATSAQRQDNELCLRLMSDHPAAHIDFVVKGLVHRGVKSPTRGKSLVFISNFQEFLMKLL